MPELDWQRYLERRALARVAPLPALLATLRVLLRRAPRLLRAALPAYLAAALWLLLRDTTAQFAFGPSAGFVAPLLVLAVDAIVLWLFVAYATAVARGLLTAVPLRALPQADRGERRTALVSLLIGLLALLTGWLLPVPLSQWSPVLFLYGLAGLDEFLGWTLAAALPGCLLLALLAPLLPAAALGPNFRGRELRAVTSGAWLGNLLVALLALALVLLALLGIHVLARGLDHVGHLRLLLAATLPGVVLLAATVLQTGFAAVFARRIGWTSGAAAAT